MKFHDYASTSLNEFIGGLVRVVAETVRMGLLEGTKATILAPVIIFELIRTFERNSCRLMKLSSVSFFFLLT